MGMRLWEVLRGAQVALPKEDREICGISNDTRTLRPGEIYVAVRGHKTDGHRYIAEARAKGCAAVVAEEGEDVLLTPDSRAALAVLAANWYRHPAEGMTLIGITGTNGKTTTATLLAHLLTEVLGTRVGLLGTNEIRIGGETYPAQRTTPESLDLQRWLRRMADSGCTHVVMEVSSHALCLDRVDTLRFAVGAFTNLTEDHLDFHGTMEAYRAAKERLFAQSDRAVLDLDDAAGRYYLGRVPCPSVTYSERCDAATLTAKDLRLFPDRVEFVAVTREALARVRLPIPGSFSIYNALCALSCAVALGLPLEESAAALSTAPAVRGRMEVVPHGGPGTVVIDYAHTPDALEKALLSLRDFTAGRLYCLFGCGGDRDRSKRPIMGAIAAQCADGYILTSDNPRGEDPAAILGDILKGTAGERPPLLIEPDREKAIQQALLLLREGDTLLLAGKGHETYQEVNGEKRHMDERELLAKLAPM